MLPSHLVSARVLCALSIAPLRPGVIDRKLVDALRSSSTGLLGGRGRDAACLPRSGCTPRRSCHRSWKGPSSVSRVGNKIERRRTGGARGLGCFSHLLSTMDKTLLYGRNALLLLDLFLDLRDLVMGGITCVSLRRLVRPSRPRGCASRCALWCFVPCSRTRCPAQSPFPSMCEPCKTAKASVPESSPRLCRATSS